MFVTVDNEGRYIGFYDSEIHNVIPPGAIVIDVEIWKKHINGELYHYNKTTGQHEPDPPPTAEEIQERLDAIEDRDTKDQLLLIDRDSIRYIREWVVIQLNPPQELIDLEQQAIMLRQQLHIRVGGK